MMIKTEFKLLRLILFFGCFFCTLPFFAQQDKHLTITSTGSLDFGRFSRQNGGTITIQPLGGTISTGDIFLLNSPRSNVSFDISSSIGKTAIVTVTANRTSLNGPSGSLELSVIFDKNSFTIDKWKHETVQMGGTLTVGPEDLPGYYTGTVSVIFAYQ